MSVTHKTPITECCIIAPGSNFPPQKATQSILPEGQRDKLDCALPLTPLTISASP